MSAVGQAMSRRALLTGALVLTAARPIFGSSTAGRIAIIDWALLETALALGLLPVGATELVQYRSNVVTPELPPGVTDIGLRGSINYELLSTLKPDVILSSNFYEQQRDLLARIAPVETFSVYEPGKPPFERAAAAMLWLAERADRADVGKRYLAETEQALHAGRAAVAKRGIRRAIVINLGDPRHFRAFGSDSMFGDVMGRLGVTNAWTEASQYTAAAPVGLDKLADIGEAYVIAVGPTPSGTAKSRSANAIWNALPAVRAGKVISLGSINHFGALPAASRFARALVLALRDCCA